MAFDFQNKISERINLEFHIENELLPIFNRQNGVGDFHPQDKIKDHAISKIEMMSLFNLFIEITTKIDSYYKNNCEFFLFNSLGDISSEKIVKYKIFDLDKIANEKIYKNNSAAFYMIDKKNIKNLFSNESKFYFPTNNVYNCPEYFQYFSINFDKNDHLLMDGYLSLNVGTVRY